MLREYDGPSRVLRVRGQFQVSIRYRPACEFLEATYVAQCLGWGYQLVATSDSQTELREYLRKRFPGCEISTH